MRQPSPLLHCKANLRLRSDLSISGVGRGRLDNESVSVQKAYCYLYSPESYTPSIMTASPAPNDGSILEEQSLTMLLGNTT